MSGETSVKPACGAAAQHIAAPASQTENIFIMVFDLFMVFVLYQNAAMPHTPQIENVTQNFSS
jgi:hypothetical protein